jgi:23S rRNA (cytidine1920-2'-O)/16S rRNA (cytidine1409-2'-O)-methyltransferase
VAHHKIRLDQLLVDRGLAETRGKAQALILAGSVRVNGAAHTKSGELVPAEAAIELVAGLPYASRGGYKLAHALDSFAIDPAGLVALDVGASTGGFTDVLLQRGAARVYAVDVGYGQIDWRLRQDPRVVVVERTNIRYLEALPSVEDQEPRTESQQPTNDQRPTTNDDGVNPKSGALGRIQNPKSKIQNRKTNDDALAQTSTLKPQHSTLADCATIDVSFISLRLVLPAVRRLITPAAWIVALIKPQFEAGAAQVGKGGVVRDPAVHLAVLREVLGFAGGIGLAPRGLVRSPITGPAGNIEFLAWLGGPGKALEIERAIGAVLRE